MLVSPLPSEGSSGTEPNGRDTQATAEKGKGHPPQKKK